MTPEVFEAMAKVREFMFVHVYTNPLAKREEKKAKGLIESLFTYYMQHIEVLPDKYTNMLSNGETKCRIVSDYIAGMTDTYASKKFQEYFVPQPWDMGD